MSRVLERIKGLLHRGEKDPDGPRTIGHHLDVLDDATLHDQCWKNVFALNAEQVGAAVNMLRVELAPFLPELRERIKENPKGWLHGRDSIPCDSCRGTGKRRYLKLALRDKVLAEVKDGVYRAEDYLKLDALAKDPANLEPEATTCEMCRGKGEHSEFSLHHGFGTAARNLLRQHGFTEEAMGIDNWDDYYVPLLEMAANTKAAKGVSHGT